MARDPHGKPQRRSIRRGTFEQAWADALSLIGDDDPPNLPPAAAAPGTPASTASAPITNPEERR